MFEWSLTINNIVLKSETRYYYCQEEEEDIDEDDDDEVESILLDHTHKWWNIWALFRRVFRSHRFKVLSVVTIFSANARFVTLVSSLILGDNKCC